MLLFLPYDFICVKRAKQRNYSVSITSGKKTFFFVWLCCVLVAFEWHKQTTAKCSEIVRRCSRLQRHILVPHLLLLNESDFTLPSIIIEHAVIMCDERLVQQHFVKQNDKKKTVLSTHFDGGSFLPPNRIWEWVRLNVLCACVTYACFIFGFYIYLRGIFFPLTIQKRICHTRWSC